jgi:hypothetical protein
MPWKAEDFMDTPKTNNAAQSKKKWTADDFNVGATQKVASTTSKKETVQKSSAQPYVTSIGAYTNEPVASGKPNLAMLNAVDKVETPAPKKNTIQKIIEYSPIPAINSLAQAPLTIGDRVARGSSEGIGGALKGFGQGLADVLTSKNPVSTGDYINNAVQGISGKNISPTIRSGLDVLSPADVIGLGQISKLGQLGKLQNIGEAAEVGIKAASKIKPSPVVETVAKESKQIKPVSPQGRYTVKNAEMQKAVEDYDNAIKQIQDHFGTNELRASEMERIKPELGVDIENIVNRMERAQGKKLLSADELRSRRAYGVASDNAYSVGSRAASQAQRTSRPQIDITASAMQNRINGLESGAIQPATKTELQDLYRKVEALGQKVPKTTVEKSKEPAGIDYTQLKDTSGFNAYTNDVYRIFKKVYGKHFDAAKKEILDPFDAAKKANIDFQKEWLGKLKTDVVDKLGIKKGSKESALVQQYGEGKITGAELKSKYSNADKIIEADKWFRSAYDTLLDKVNSVMKEIYPNNPEKIIPKRKDYYRHFNELQDTFQGVKNLFETPAQINPSLVGVSDFTKPKSRFLSFAQKRGLGPYKNDAVGGFLNYIRPASQAVNIDPQIQKFRGLAKNISEQTADSKNLNTFIEFLQDFSNNLSGKTNPFDRPVQKVIGRKAMNIINWGNGRVKSNVVLGNAASSLAQLANIPSGIAYVKNPKHISGGMLDMFTSIFNKNNPMKNSGFLSERYSDKLYSQFDSKILDQPYKFAAWLLGVGDEIGTKFIWNSVYRKAIAENITNPINYADNATRSLVAGRGIGEMPIIQQSKLFQVIAPFQLEVGNLWRVMGDRVKEKDFVGLATLLVANYLFNRGAEKVRGSGVTFDPVQAFIDAFQEKDSNGEPITNLQRVGRLAGEVLSNIPLGQTIAAQLPEDIRKQYLGKNDPTRFGTGLTVTKGIQDPLYKLLPSFGGAQIKKTVEGIQTLRKGGVFDKNKEGEYLKYPVANTTENKIKGVLFGKSGLSETQNYYNQNLRPLGVNQTLLAKQTGQDLNSIYKGMQLNREMDRANRDGQDIKPFKSNVVDYYNSTNDLTVFADVPGKTLSHKGKDGTKKITLTDEEYASLLQKSLQYAAESVRIINDARFRNTYTSLSADKKYDFLRKKVNEGYNKAENEFLRTRGLIK